MTKKVRIGNDIDIAWTVNLTRPDGSVVDLGTLDLAVQLIVGTKEYDITNANAGLTITGNVISFTFYGSRQVYTGSYILKLRDAVNTSVTYDVYNAFILVDHTWESIDVISQPTSVQYESAVEVSRVIITEGGQGPVGPKGDPGDPGSGIHLDLDNEHENILYDDSGTNISGAVVSHATLRTISEVISPADINWSISEYSGTSADYASINPDTATLTLTHITATKAKVTVCAEYPKDSGLFYYASLTSNKTRQDKYDLVLEPSSIAYNATTYTNKTVSIGATHLNLSGVKTNLSFGSYTNPLNISTTSAKGTLRLFCSWITGSTLGTASQVTTNQITVNATNAAAFDGIYFELRRYTDPDGNNSTEHIIADYETIPISHAKDGKNGDSAWFADLDNEMDSVACDSSEHPIASQTVSTNIVLYCGDRKKNFFTSVPGYENGVQQDGITVSWGNDSSADADDTVQVSFGPTSTIINKKVFSIVLTSADDSSVVRTLTFTIAGIKGGAIYSLSPSSSVISKSTLNAYSPATISCSYTKYEIAKSAFVAPGQSEGTIKYTVDGGTSETLYSSALTPGTDFTTNVCFLLYVNGNLVDRETIPIISDGGSGTSVGINLDLDNENDSMLYTAEDTLVSGNVICTATIFDGSTDVTSTVTANSGWSISASGCTATNTNNIVTVTGMTALSGYVIVTAAYDGGTYQKKLSLKKLIGGSKYEIVTDPTSIAYNETTDTPATSSLTVQCYKTDATGVRSLSAPPSGYKIVVYGNSKLGSTTSSSLTISDIDNSSEGSLKCFIANTENYPFDFTSASPDDVLDFETVPIAKSENGAQGTAGGFRSIIFCRTNKDMSTHAPTGGSYASPFPNPSTVVVDGESVTWSSDVPSGSAILWVSVCTFYENTVTPAWSTPVKETETYLLEVLFSQSVNTPAAPSGNVPFADHFSEGWYEPSNLPTGDMVWRAERSVRNGVYYGDWVISKIKGKDGNDSTVPGPAGKSIRITVWQEGRKYYNGTEAADDGIYYLDVVTDISIAVGYSNVNAYVCKRTHTSDSSHDYHDSSLWDSLDNAAPFITPFILAEKIKSSFIDVDELAADAAFISNLDVNKLNNASGTSSYLQIADAEIKVLDSDKALRTWVHGGNLSDFNANRTESFSATIGTNSSTNSSYRATKTIRSFALNSASDTIKTLGAKTISFSYSGTCSSLVTAGISLEFKCKIKLYAFNKASNTSSTIYESASTSFYISTNPGNNISGSTTITVPAYTAHALGSGPYDICADFEIIPNTGAFYQYVNNHNFTVSQSSAFDFQVYHYAQGIPQVTEIAKDGVQIYKDASHYLLLGTTTIGGGAVGGFEFRAGGRGFRMSEGAGFQKWENGAWVSASL